MRENCTAFQADLALALWSCAWVHLGRLAVMPFSDSSVHAFVCVDVSTVCMYGWMDGWLDGCNVCNVCNVCM